MSAFYVWDGLFLILFSLPYIFLAPIIPYERIIWRDDRTIMFPFKATEIVPGWALPLFCFLLPALMMALWMGIKKFRNRRLFVAFLGLLLSIALTTQITLILKAMVGRPRPDFLARCDPDTKMTDRLVCRGNAKIVAEGRRSFPSGHSSSCFAGLGFAGFFLAGQWHIFDGEGATYRLVGSIVPFVIASMVAVTRIMDYRHHWQDVLAGSLLGLIISYLCYRLYFPPITSEHPEEPLDKRSKKLSEKDAPPINGVVYHENGPEAV